MLFGILGALDVRRDDGTPVAVGGPRSRALLALLLLDPGRIVGVERLIDGLYGANPPGGAANALQSQVSRLRRSLRDGAGTGEPVEFHPAGYRLVADAEDVDAHRFQRLALAGQSALADGDHRRAAALLSEALGLWRGPALADVADAPFAAAQAARLDELRVAAIEDRAEAELALGGHRTVVAELQDLVATHPLRERPRGQLMRALYGSGRQAEALAVYEHARRTLAEELGADPSAELAAVHLAMLRADPALAAPASVAPTTRTVPASAAETATARLPAQLTSFVGREEELRRIGTLLGETRLVTLVGPGGAGKTRLAIEAARREQNAHREPGDICFVDLAPVGDRSELAQAVLGALGLRGIGLLPGAIGTPEPAPDPVGRLVAALTERRVLLILDNCEHVIEDAARLAHRLLGACPDLRVLATSREPLGITGEALRPLPPLGWPPAGTPADEALGYPAVRLFADRAVAVRAEFTVDTGTVDAVLRICDALDGLPLAIELAAARLRSLPITEVAARLDDRFRLLSRGDRTAVPRHQTLRAVVEWSWDLLTDAERLLARRLTVFAGGAMFDAVVRVCGLPGAETDELLADLADKSLLQRDGDRYRMLDTVRAFCAERLAEAGEAQRLHRAHATYVLDLAEAASPHLLRAEQLEWLTRLTAEHGNLHAALRWAVRGDPALALRLLAALSWYWWLRGLRNEIAPLAGELLEVLDGHPEVPGELAEEYVLCLLNAVSDGRRTPERRRHVDQVESIMSALDRPPRRPYLLVLWAMATPIPSADTISQRRRRLIGTDPWCQALDHFSLGYMRLFSGDPIAAESDFGIALDGFRALGDRWGTANALDALAELVDLQGNMERSRALIDESLDLVEQLGAVEDMADLLCRRADRLTRTGDLDAARADYENAAGLARRAGKTTTLAGAHYGLGELARQRGDGAEARRLLEAALSDCATEGMTVDLTRWRALVALGRLAEAEGDADTARARHRQAFTAAVERRHLQSTAPAVEGLAGVALLDGDGERAALLLGTGRALRGGIVPGDPDVARVATRARELIGDATYTTAYERGAASTHEEALTIVGE